MQNIANGGSIDDKELVEKLYKDTSDFLSAQEYANTLFINGEINSHTNLKTLTAKNHVTVVQTYEELEEAQINMSVVQDANDLFANWLS